MADVDYTANVPDKEERKRLRAERVAAKTRRDEGDAAGFGAAAAEAAESRSKGQQQIADSLAHLDKKKAGGIEKITEIRVKADWRESQRRAAEERQRQSRLQRLQEEAVRSGKQNAAVEMRWAELLDQNMPQELHRDIEEQKGSCAAIIASKDGLIREFQLQLKAKDEEYVKALKQQADDVELLLVRMRAEFHDLQEEYENELEAIEDMFLTERDELLQSNKAEIDGLFDKRREMELEYMEAKQRREAQYQREIEELLVKDAEEYNKLKIKLETDIQTLEQQLEEMRATYQLNTEKLEYNYRVLTERDNENSNTLAQLKRKQNKLKDTLSALVQKYSETDARDRKKNDELTEEYRRITKQYKDLQAKFRHFEDSDKSRYDQIWKMHEEEVGSLVGKVLKADEIVHRQLLGFDWRGPDMDLLRDPSLAGGAGGTVDAVAAAAAAAAAVSGKAEADDKSAAAAARVVSGAKVKQMLELLASEAGFLVDSKVRTALDSMNPEEADLARAESMLRTLGVASEADVTALVEHFFAGGGGDETTVGDGTMLDASTVAASYTAEDTPDALAALQSMVRPDDVIAAISGYVAARKAGNTGSAADEAAALSAAEATRRRTDLEAEESAFWNRQASVIGKESFQVWKQLEKSLHGYNDILRQRARYIDEVSSLRDQNGQLKKLLNQYLSAKVNEELIVPPTDTIQLSAA